MMFLTFSQDPNIYYYRESKYINNQRKKNQNKKITKAMKRERET